MLPQARHNADHHNRLPGDVMAKQNLGITATKIIFWTKIEKKKKKDCEQLGRSAGSTLYEKGRQKDLAREETFMVILHINTHV